MRPEGCVACTAPGLSGYYLRSPLLRRNRHRWVGPGGETWFCNTALTAHYPSRPGERIYLAACPQFVDSPNAFAITLRVDTADKASLSLDGRHERPPSPLRDFLRAALWNNRGLLSTDRGLLSTVMHATALEPHGAIYHGWGWVLHGPERRRRP